MKMTKKLTVIAAVVLCILPLMITDPYVMHMVVLALIYSILASSLNLLIGYSGLVSLGHHAFFGVGAYTSALLAVDGSMPFEVCIIMSGVASMFFAYLIGTITLRLRSHYFVISTIAVGEIMRLVSINWDKVTRGPMGIVNIPPPSIFGISFNTPGEAYYLVLILAVLSIYIVYKLVNSEIGRSLRTRRAAEYLSLAVGTNVNKKLMITLLISACMAGVAGSVYAHYLRFLSPDVFYFVVSVTLVIMVIGGGVGTIWGPVIGAVVFTVLPEALRFSEQYRLIIYGVSFIILIRFLPNGLWGLITRIRGKLLVERTSR